MTNEALKLMESKRDNGPIIPIVYYKYTHGSFNVNNGSYYHFKNHIK
jgi:hypothetical protein